MHQVRGRLHCSASRGPNRRRALVWLTSFEGQNSNHDGRAKQP